MRGALRVRPQPLSLTKIEGPVPGIGRSSPSSLLRICERKDTPAKYLVNVNVASLPSDRREWVEPAYDDAEVDAIVAFLETLTDAAYRSPWAS
jgi:hypothetical protein